MQKGVLAVLLESFCLPSKMGVHAATGLCAWHLMQKGVLAAFRIWFCQLRQDGSCQLVLGVLQKGVLVLPHVSAE